MGFGKITTANFFLLFKDQSGMRQSNKGRRYNVTTSLISWAHAYIDPCFLEKFTATYYRYMTSSAQVEIYPSQLRTRQLLLLI